MRDRERFVGRLAVSQIPIIGGIETDRFRSRHIQKREAVPIKPLAVHLAFPVMRRLIQHYGAFESLAVFWRSTIALLMSIFAPSRPVPEQETVALMESPEVHCNTSTIGLQKIVGPAAHVRCLLPIIQLLHGALSEHFRKPGNPMCGQKFVVLVRIAGLQLSP